MKKDKIYKAINKAEDFLNEALDIDTEDKDSIKWSLKSLRLAKNQITKAELLLNTESRKIGKP